MTSQPAFLLRRHKLTRDQLMAAQRVRQSHDRLSLSTTMRKVLYQALIEGQFLPYREVSYA